MTGTLNVWVQARFAGVMVLPVDLSPDTAGEGVPVSDDEIEARLRALRIDDSD